MDRIKKYAAENDVSFVFECVDMENDPHIIEYAENEIVLLDIVKNDINFSKVDYSELCSISDRLGLKHKILAYEIKDKADFELWYKTVTAEAYNFEGQKIEGFVLEDMNGFMTKLKGNYYQFWKRLRGVAHTAIKNGKIKDTAMLKTELEKEFYEWVRQFYKTDMAEKIPKDICSLRTMFYKHQNK